MNSRQAVAVHFERIDGPLSGLEWNSCGGNIKEDPEGGKHALYQANFHNVALLASNDSAVWIDFFRHRFRTYFCIVFAPVSP
jgi:hypothetical protein